MIKSRGKHNNIKYNNNNNKLISLKKIQSHMPNMEYNINNKY